MPELPVHGSLIQPQRLACVVQTCLGCCKPWHQQPIYRQACHSTHLARRMVASSSTKPTSQARRPGFSPWAASPTRAMWRCRATLLSCGACPEWGWMPRPGVSRGRYMAGIRLSTASLQPRGMVRGLERGACAVAALLEGRGLHATASWAEGGPAARSDLPCRYAGAASYFSTADAGWLCAQGACMHGGYV